MCLLAFGNFALATGAFVVPGLLATLSDDLAVPVATGGALMSAYALTYAVSSPLLMAVTGALPRRRALLLGMSLVAVGNLALAVAPDFGSAVATRVVSGIGGALYSPVAASVAVALAPPERRARALALVFTGMTVAQVLGIPIGTQLAFAFGWRAVFVIVAGIALVAMALLIARVPSDLDVPRSDLGQLARLAVDPTVAATVGVTVLFFSGQFVVYTFLGPVITATSGAVGGTLTLLLWILGVASVVANFTGGFAADRFGPRPTLIVMISASALVLAILPALQTTPAIVALFLIVWGFAGYGFMTPQQSSLVALRPDAAGLALSLNASALYAGSAIGGLAGATIVAAGGLDSLGWGAAALLLAALALLQVSARLTARPAAT